MRELAGNASKANFKIAFEKHIAAPKGISPEKNYKEFIASFKEEFSSETDNLLDLVKANNIFFNVYMQSTDNSIDIWVTNYTATSEIEKKRIYKKLKIATSQMLDLHENPDGHAEGAGMGINLVKQVLNKLTVDEEPIKLFFYPDFFKIGFILKRKE